MCSNDSPAQSVRTYLAGHLAMAGNALTELSQAVSAGQPVTQAILDQMERCDRVVWRAYSALIDMFGADWPAVAVRLNQLDERLAELDQRQKEDSDGK